MSKAKNVEPLERKVRQVLADIMREHANEDLRRSDIVELVLSSKGIPVEWLEGIQQRAISKEIGRILRSQKFTTEQGDELRKYQAYKMFVQENGREVQQTFWRDIDTMNRVQMLACYRSRKELADRTDKQAEKTRAYWNKNVAPRIGAKPIQKQLFE